MGREIRRENVKVEHFLSRLDILMEPSILSFVKDLQSRALGEVQIREALQELKVCSNLEDTICNIYLYIFFRYGKELQR